MPVAERYVSAARRLPRVGPEAPVDRFECRPSYAAGPFRSLIILPGFVLAAAGVSRRRGRAS